MARRPHPGWLPPALLCAALLAWAAPAAAFLEEPGQPARHRIIYTSLTAAEYNPWGLQADLLTGYRYRLVTSEKPLWRDTFVGVRQVTRITPAYTRLGALVELQPLAVLTLRAHYEHRDYFGVLKNLQSYPSLYSAFDDDTATRRADQGLNYAGRGHQLWLQISLRAKVGPIAVLNETEIHDFRMSLHHGDRVFYDAYFDTLVPGNGWIVANHAHLIGFLSPRLLLGARYTVVHALYPHSWLVPGVGNPNTPSHKIGPLAAYVIPSRSRRFRQPTLIAFANWWVRSRYRAGQAVNQGVPCAVLAFQVNGELWSR